MRIFLVGRRLVLEFVFIKREHRCGIFGEGTWLKIVKADGETEP